MLWHSVVELVTRFHAFFTRAVGCAQEVCDEDGFDGSWYSSQGSGYMMPKLISGDTLTWHDGEVTQVTINARRIKMTFAGNCCIGELQADNKIYWNDGDTWLRHEVQHSSLEPPDCDVGPVVHLGNIPDCETELSTISTCSSDDVNATNGAHTEGESRKDDVILNDPAVEKMTTEQARSALKMILFTAMMRMGKTKDFACWKMASKLVDKSMETTSSMDGGSRGGVITTTSPPSSVRERIRALESSGQKA